MSIDAYQRIAAAVTPAVMVSACGLVALGLDNQAARMSMRVRELVREERVAGSTRRKVLHGQVRILDRRHAILAWALRLNYAALLAFVLTSLSALAQGVFPLPLAIPVAVFAIGVVLLGGVAVCALSSLRLSRAAILIEIEQRPPPEDDDHEDD